MKLLKMIERLAYKYGLHDVFADFVEMSALAISNAVDKRQFDGREARYMQIVKRYTKDEVQQFPRMLGALVDELETQGWDVLGRAFGELEVHNKWRGQFFTPYEVCRLMASVNIDAAHMDALIAQRGFVTLNEPTVGAGAMVLAFADRMRNAGYNPQTQLHVTAQDIDPRAVHMAYIQLSLMHIPAVVVLGNTLKVEQREVWYTPAHIMGGWSWKLQRTEQPAPVSVPAPVPAPIPPAQPSSPEQLGLFC